MPDKSDAEIFRRRLSNLKKEKWLGPRQWWPDFLFHHTDISKVANVLRIGYLLSRTQVKATLKDFLDSASPDVIGHTDNQVKDCVRFYFRPRTPTFWHIEGFRPKRPRTFADAHCPVPVYLLFDFEKVICREDSMFSEGTLAGTGRRILSKGTDFEKLPFQLIYHDGPVAPEERDKIVYHRHAEVIVPRKIGLSDLKKIWCRSQAEYETLRHLLGETLWQKWQEKITARTDYSLFHRRWAYVESVVLSNSHIRIRFNKPFNADDAGPFAVSIKIIEHSTGKVYEWSDTNYTIGDHETVSLSNLSHPQNYKVEFFIDNHLAYAKEFQEEIDIPF